MDRIELFHQWTRELIPAHAMADLNNPEIECQLIFDSEHDRFQVSAISVLQIRYNKHSISQSQDL